MSKYSRKTKAFALIAVMSALLVAALIPGIAYAQSATVTIFTSVGGSASASPTGAYADGTVVTLTATAGTGFLFSYWAIASAAGGYQDNNNPTTLTVSDSNAYGVQAVFQPIGSVPGVPVNPINDTDAIVVVLAAVGGTTSPAAGIYYLNNATSLSLMATADNGFTFDHWVIGGVPITNAHGGYSFTDTPTNNPYNVNHGYGNTYSYQPVFSPTSSTTSPTVPEFSSGIVVAIALIAVLIASGVYVFNKKK